ncbi:MAG: NUDIX domain-containing protein [Crocinitomix sp.]|nr:NUDIX domain-containing protein [Crocinitomix sp.]
MYKIEFDNFFTYSFSSDCVIFGFRDGEISVLLIKRAMEPFKDQWAIPGDLIYPDEDLLDASKRILFELTQLTDIDLHQAETFGKPNRHPQGRVITCAHFALLRIDDFHAEASSWAKEVAWIPIHKVTGLAFDHNVILNSTYDLLKQKLAIEPVCFDMLPEKFTLSEMQSLYEYAFDTVMDKANFRKKIKSIPLKKLSEKQQNVKHRPAQLFSFDQDKFKEMVETNHYNFKMY